MCLDNETDLNSSAKSDAAVVSERSFIGGGSKRRSLHNRRRSSILLGVNINSSEFTNLRKSRLSSPSLVATNESFCATVLDLDEAKCELEAAKLVNERKKHLYDIIELLFEKQNELKNEEKRLNVEIAESFQELLKN